MKRIWLADLTHTGLGIATEAMPLNIGLIASYAKKYFDREKLEIELFKYPEDLYSELQSLQPDILGFSNYTWNSNLAYYFTRLVKRLSPNTVTVWGGTNYPFLAQQQKTFLEKRPELDFHVYYEGEKAFLSLLNTLSESELVSIKKAKTRIDGIQYLSEGDLISGSEIPRISTLDEIPSPYSTGLLDKFFDGQLTPLVETARGCPFKCNYCNAGDVYFNRVHQFSNEYIRDELTYIAKKAGPLGIGHITFCDNNFGMLARDEETAKLLAQLQKDYNFPSSITVWTGKNSKDRVIEATKILGDTLNISMSVQAMDKNVLKEIKRQNIDLDSYRSIANYLNAEGRPQHAEVIMPLPGETFSSHILGLKELVDTNVDRVFSHTLQMLHGTEYKDNDSYRDQFGFITKFRLVPLDFSKIGDEIIFDVEEVAVGTKDMSFDEYCNARLFALTIDLSFNTNTMKPFIKFAREHQIPISTLIENLWLRISSTRNDFYNVIESFKKDTISELWESEEELVSFYSKPENYSKLIDGEIGGNVLFKHRVWILTRYSKSWADFIAQVLDEMKVNQLSDGKKFTEELDEVKNFVQCTIMGAFEEDAVEKSFVKSFSFNFVDWMKPNSKLRLSESKKPTKLRFEILDSKKKIIIDARKRYGFDLKGHIKLIQRTNYSPSFSPFIDSTNLEEHTPQNEFWRAL